MRDTEQSIQAVEAYLETFLQSKLVPARRIDPIYAELVQEIARLLQRGGKRLRPRLTLLAYEGMGGINHEAAVRAAASQELFHAFMLMHDDIIDRDTTRWGGPNIAGRYRQKFTDAGLAKDDREHFADAWALLAGDLCFALSQESLLRSGFTPDAVTRAGLVLQQTLFDVVGGEVLDTALSIFKAPLPGKKQLVAVCHYKTAIYSFMAPLKIGALLAGADEQCLQRIDRFGRPLGIAYQLQDDLLGMFGDEKRLGKPTISDLREGKRTLLIANALALGTVQERRLLAEKLGNPDVTARDLRLVQGVLTTSGARATTERTAETYRQQAVRALPAIGFSPAVTQQLAALAELATTRTN